MNEIDRYINEIDTFMKKLNLNRDKINEFKVQLEAEFEDFIVERNNPDNKRELEKFFVESLDPPELMARNLGEAQKGNFRLYFSMLNFNYHKCGHFFMNYQ